MKITKIKANNFKSLKNFEINFSRNTNINIIYGVNGAGKSTIISILSVIQKVLLLKAEEHNHLSVNLPFQPQNIYDLNRIYNEASTIGFKDEIELGIEFVDQKDNKYYFDLNLGPNGIVTYEEFGHIVNKEKEMYFGKKFNSWIDSKKINNLFKKEMYDLNKLEKNSIASLIYYIILKRHEEIRRELSSDEYKFIIPLFDVFANFSYFLKASPKEIPILETIDQLYVNGIIHLNASHPDFNKWYKKLESSIEKFSDFACSIDSSIIEVKIINRPIRGTYDTSISFGFLKRINGKVIVIPWERESSGTKSYSKLYNIYYQIKNKKFSFITLIDELGGELNEVLTANIYNKFYRVAKDLDKQLIITTHSSILLNRNFLNQKNNSNWNKERFIIDRNLVDGVTRVMSLKNVDNKENNQRKYLIGKYGGVPLFKELLSE